MGDHGSEAESKNAEEAAHGVPGLAVLYPHLPTAITHALQTAQ